MECKDICHDTRNGVQALMGQSIVLGEKITTLSMMIADLEEIKYNIDSQIKRIGEAVHKCK